MSKKPEVSITAIYGFAQKTMVLRPLFSSGVSAGFPSPAEDYIEQRLDLNELLIQNPAATFFVRVSGDSMEGAGINDGDILVVDRSLAPASGRIVVAIIHGEFTVKRLYRDVHSCRLLAENPAYPAIEVSEESGCEIWGIVTSSIHQF
jgi:DNA polymerase V